MREKVHTGTNAFRKLFEKKLVTVTGMTRSGKSYLAPIVCSFKGAERLFMDNVFEQLDLLKNFLESCLCSFQLQNCNHRTYLYLFDMLFLSP